MKIGMFSETYLPTPDGVANYVANLSNELIKQKHEVSIFTAGIKTVKEENVHRFKSVKFPPYPQYRIALLHFSKIYKMIKKENFDIVHLHTPFSIGTAGFISAKLKKIPIVGTFHTNFLDMKESVDFPIAKNFLFNLAWTYNIGIYKRCGEITTPSQRVKEFLLKTNPNDFKKEIKVIWNGIDVNKFSPNANKINLREKYNLKNKIIITFISRLTKDKGLYTLVDTIEILKEKYDIVCLIGGIGPEEKRIREYVKNKNMLNFIKILGYLEEEHKPSIIAQSDIFVLPSKADVQPLCVLEAMSSGTVVIGANSGGIPDLVKENFNGVLFEYGNANQFAEKISLIIENKNLSMKLRENGMKFVREEGSIEKSAERFLEIYEGLKRR